ncbi:MAG: tripartite tricarboxylate transporter TctB family protein [Clostridia bacterium]|nr:tripartite tricarboxylate transporter TctB family protein [Clostridia bacterium]
MSFKKCKDLILGIVMLLFSGFYLIYAQQIKTRPKLTPSYASAKIMPTLLGVLLAILSVFCIIQGIRAMKAPEKKEDKSKKLNRGDVMAVVFTFAVIIGYILIMPILGFILSTVIYLFLQMLILAPAEKRNYALFAIVAVVFTALVFVAFRIGLQQLLPRGVIEGLLGF